MKINKSIILGGKSVSYELEYKRVKNINLRVRADGSIYVSANNRVSELKIEEFIISHSDFIAKALDKYEAVLYNQPVSCFSQTEIRAVIEEICREVYPFYQAYGVKYPKIKYRKMVSRWGTCNYSKGILTFNTNLMYAPRECIEYVVHHEFTHFLEPNHSKRFYEKLEQVCPNFAKCRKELSKINLR